MKLSGSFPLELVLIFAPRTFSPNVLFCCDGCLNYLHCVIGMGQEKGKVEDFFFHKQCELNKKGNRDSILNLSKSKRQIMILLSVNDSIFVFLSYGTLVVHIG